MESTRLLHEVNENKVFKTTHYGEEKTQSSKVLNPEGKKNKNKKPNRYTDRKHLTKSVKRSEPKYSNTSKYCLN